MMKIYLAPLRGFTEVIFRNTYSENFSGVDIAVGPFIPSSLGRKIHISHLRDILPEKNKKMAVIPQILSNSPKDFIRLAKRLSDYGYDRINWNLGCPFNIVAKKRRGSGLLPFSSDIQRFLDAVIPEIPNALSIKTRLGRASADDIFDLIPIFNAYPLTDLTIHPRTGIQLYEGDLDLDSFERCLSLSKHPIIYNGDIVNAISFNKLSSRFQSIDQWMIGRGIIANPFLPEILKKGRDDIDHKLERFAHFHDQLVRGYEAVIKNPHHVVDKMKGFWRYFSQSFEDQKGVLQKIQGVDDIINYEKKVKSLLDGGVVWKECSSLTD